MRYVEVALLPSGVTSQFIQQITYASTSLKVRPLLPPLTLKLVYKNPSGVIQLDSTSIANLGPRLSLFIHLPEIVRNSRTGDARTSLFGILNHCKTPMGGPAASSPTQPPARLLRTTLLQPISSVTQRDTLNLRLDLVSVSHAAFVLTPPSSVVA